MHEALVQKVAVTVAEHVFWKPLLGLPSRSREHTGAPDGPGKKISGTAQAHAWYSARTAGLMLGTGGAGGHVEPVPSGDGGDAIDCGGRGPQSAQSVPYAQSCWYSEPGPPSSQSPSEAAEQVLAHNMPLTGEGDR